MKNHLYSCFNYNKNNIYSSEYSKSIRVCSILTEFGEMFTYIGIRSANSLYLLHVKLFDLRVHCNISAETKLINIFRNVRAKKYFCRNYFVLDDNNTFQ